MNKLWGFELIFLLLINITLSCEVCASNFYSAQKRGWFWHEENQKRQQEKKLTPAEAFALVNLQKQELEESRALMVAAPTDENILSYRKLEAKMWQKSLTVGMKWQQLNFTDPSLFDRTIDPANVHAVRLRREGETKATESHIKEVAAEYSLVLFRKGGCLYCEEFEPILAHFAKKYNFEVEAVNLDDSEAVFFPSRKVFGLAERLGVEATPTVIMVKRGGGDAKELSRGLVTITELEELGQQAWIYFKDRGMK